MDIKVLKINFSQMNASQLSSSRMVASNYLQKKKKGVEYIWVPSLLFEQRSCYVTEYILYMVQYPKDHGKNIPTRNPTEATGQFHLPSLMSSCCPSVSQGNTDP